MTSKKWWMALLLSLIALPALAQKQDPASTPGGCPGMMMGGGYGYHHGYGMGPGMMGGGYGMMGPGMMGEGYGMGPGMMGYGYGFGALELSDKQQAAINRAMDENRKTTFETMGKMADLQARLRDLYAKDQWDADAIVKVYDQIGDLRNAMIRSRIQMRNQIWAQLDKDQRQRLKRFGPGWAME